jgi:hypothetical protein
MGEAEINMDSHLITIHAVFIIYGDAANQEIAHHISSEINSMWNEPEARVRIRNEWWLVKFAIDAEYEPGLSPETVWYNDNPRKNYFRVEEWAQGNISYVDGIACNTGYFKADNLLNFSTTAAHEFGHTIGLVHPQNLDLRGEGQPCIMYPRGTICDPAYQYDPKANPLAPGGTMNPRFRKVRQRDIEDLKLNHLHFSDRGLAVLGNFSSLFHEKELPAE